MKSIKMLIIGVGVGTLMGLWIGHNIGRDQPWLSNPFAQRTLAESLKNTGRGIGELLEKGGQSLQQ